MKFRGCKYKLLKLGEVGSQFGEKNVLGVKCTKSETTGAVFVVQKLVGSVSG